MRWLYRALSLYWLLRAAARGPGALGRYLVRREMRRSLNRPLTGAFRRSGLYGRRGGTRRA